MIAEIKRQKIADLEDYKKLVKEITEVLEKYEKELRNQKIFMDELNNFHFIKKIFHKRYYQNTKKSLLTTESIIQDLEEQVQKLKLEFQKFTLEHQSLFFEISIPKNFEKYYNLEKTFAEAKENIENKQTIRDFNFSYKEAVEYLKQNNLPIYLDENDKIIIENNISFDSLNNFVLVHKTNYPPVNNRVHSSIEAKVMIKTIVLDKVGSITYANPRNTVHFSVNGEVSSHIYGSWDECKYAIIIPFPDMPIERLQSGAVMDTFFEGGINLPNSAILLCPFEEIETIKKQNNDMNILGYKDQNVSGYANALVGMLGKKVERVGMWSWINENETTEYYEKIATKYKFPSTGPHVDSIQNLEEDTRMKLNKLFALSDKLLNEKIILNDEDIISILDIGINNLFSFKEEFEEKSKNLIKEGIEKIQEYMSNINRKIPDELMDKIEELLFNSTYHITKQELNDYNQKTQKKEYYISNTEYANFLLLQSFFSNINQYIQSKNRDVEPDDHKTMGFTAPWLIAILVSIFTVGFVIFGTYFILK